MCNYTITDAETREQYVIEDIAPTCGFNSEANLYCPVMQGDILEIISPTILKDLKSFFEGKKYFCHTKSTLWQCADIQEDLDNHPTLRPVLRALYYLSNKGTNYALIANNPLCVE